MCVCAFGSRGLWLWGPEAQMRPTFLTAIIIRTNCCRSQATSAHYGRLNLVLVRQMPEPRVEIIAIISRYLAILAINRRAEMTSTCQVNCHDNHSMTG